MLLRADVGLHGRTRPVGREAKRGRQRRRELTEPVALGLLRLRSAAAGGLRQCVLDEAVGWPQADGSARALRGVELFKFAENDSHRPAVAHDVVHREGEDVVVGREPEQPRAQQRAVRAVERLAAQLSEQPRRFGLAFAVALPCEI